MTPEQIEFHRKSFIAELNDLLKKYECEIQAKDHYDGYAECGEDIRMIVDFSDYQIPDIDLGSFIWADCSVFEEIQSLGLKVKE